MSLFQRILSFSIIFILSSCSGYHFKKNGNLFSINGIRTIAIPMFINKSIIPNLSAPMTKEISLLLSRYPDIAVYAGESQPKDAILIGILNSKQQRKEVFQTEASTITGGLLEESIGGRNQFNLPTSTKYKLTLRLVLIKNPNFYDIELLKSGLGPMINRHPKVVFNEIFNLEAIYARTIGDNINADSAGVTNFSKNRATFENSLRELSRTAANEFKETVLDAF